MHSSIRIRRPLVPYAALHRGSTRWAACLEPFLVYTLAFWLQCVTLRTACVRAIACNVSSRPPPRRSIVSYSNRPHLVRVLNEVMSTNYEVERNRPVSFTSLSCSFSIHPCRDQSRGSAVHAFIIKPYDICIAARSASAARVFLLRCCRPTSIPAHH